MTRICFLRCGDEIIIDSLALGFAKIGFETKTVVVDPTAPSFDFIRQEIEKFSPDVCLTHNFYAFDFFQPELSLENYLFEKQIPCVAWFWDSPFASGTFSTSQRFLQGKIAPNILSLATDTGHYDGLRRRGLRSDFLALGVADEFFEWSGRLGPSYESRFKFDVCFAGKPVQFHSAHQLKTADEMLLLYANSVLSHALNVTKIHYSTEDEARRGHALKVECFRDGISEFFSHLYTRTEDYEGAKDRLIRRIRSMLGEQVADQYLPFAGYLDFFYSWFQLNLYLHELREFNLGVFGGDQWQKLLPGYSCATPKLTQDELLASFRFSKVSFGLTKWQFQNMAHERVFIAYACGGFPLTDYRSDLVDLFEKDELVMYREIEEAKDLVRFYLKNESERIRVTEKGRARVMREHTYSKRATALAQILHRHFGTALVK